MNWADRLKQWWAERMPQEPPPVKTPDPDLVDHAMKTTRALAQSDRALERRRRLNLELDHAEDVIRRARANRADR